MPTAPPVRLRPGFPAQEGLHVARSRDRPPHRHARPHPRRGQRNPDAAGGVERHPGLDRAAQRGERGRRGAADRRGNHGAEDARGFGDRRRLSRQGAGQRARPRGQLLRRAEGGRMSLPDLTIAEARDGLLARQFSAEEITLAHLHAIEALNPRLNAYLTVSHARAVDQARAGDAALARGEARALTGIPLAIKDLFCTAGVRTTAGSRILGPFVPPYESTVTANLLRDGAIFLGKTNMDEFAMGSSNMTSAYGPVTNPWKRRQDATAVLVPGGSSGGSAAAVSARLAMGATGTDTGGSIRQPASFCGIVGLKPTYGRCSRWGVVAFASSLDHPGPFARDVRDCAILLGSMAGHDPKDSTSADVAVPDFRAACARGSRAADRRAAGIPRRRDGRGDRRAVAAGHR